MEGKAMPAKDNDSEQPRRFRPSFMFQLEEQRRQRRLEALERRFDATIQHIDQVERVNEECYRRQLDLTQAARTGASTSPMPPPLPLAVPPAKAASRPWVPPQMIFKTPRPMPSKAAPKTAAKKTKRKK